MKQLLTPYSHLITAGLILGCGTNASAIEIPGANNTIQSLADMIETYVNTTNRAELNSPEEQNLFDICSAYQTQIGNAVAGGEGSPEDIAVVVTMLEGISHEEVGAIASGFTDTRQDLMDNVVGRMQQLRSKTPLLASNSMLLGQTGGAAGDDFSRLSAYTNFSLGDGSKDRTSNENGFEFDSQAFTVGADYRLSDASIVGAALGIGMSDVDMDKTAVSSANTESDSVSFTLYATHYQDDWYLDGSLGFASHEYDNTRRVIDVGMGIDQTLTSAPEGNSFTAAFGGGINQQYGAWTADYALRLEHVSASVDGYSESGGSLALNVEEQEVDSLQAILAAQFSKAYSTEHGVIMAMLGIEMHQEFDDETRVVTAAYKFDPAKNQFSFTSDDADSNYFLLSAGSSWVMAQGRQLFVNWDHVAGLSDVSSNTVTAGFRMEL